MTGLPAPDGAMLVSPELTASALAARGDLEVYAQGRGLYRATEAADVLAVSEAGIVELMGTGKLDGVLVNGVAYVVPAQVQARLLAAAASGLAETMALRTQARIALRGLLAEREVTSSWVRARNEQRPLVCARRGAARLHHGIRFHSVVLSSTWVSQWAAAHAEQRPELATTPVGAVWHEVLRELPGVRDVRYANALEPDGTTHKLTRWVRVDTEVWPVTIPADVAERVGRA